MSSKNDPFTCSLRTKVKSTKLPKGRRGEKEKDTENDVDSNTSVLPEAMAPSTGHSSRRRTAASTASTITCNIDLSFS